MTLVARREFPAGLLSSRVAAGTGSAADRWEESGTVCYSPALDRGVYDSIRWGDELHSR